MKKAKKIILVTLGGYLGIPIMSKIWKNANEYWENKNTQFGSYFEKKKRNKIYTKMLPIWLEQGLVYQDKTNNLYYVIERKKHEDNNDCGLSMLYDWNDPVTKDNFYWKHDLPKE